VVDQPLPIFLQQLAGGLGVLGLLQAGPAACEWQRSILKQGMGTSAAAAAADNADKSPWQLALMLHLIVTGRPHKMQARKQRQLLGRF
jgi:hypothetical protein